MNRMIFEKLSELAGISKKLTDENEPTEKVIVTMAFLLYYY